MVKRFLLSLALLLATMSSAVVAQTVVTVGDGTTNGRIAPFNHYYNNGTAAMVYDASNFDAACDITSIAFQVASSITKTCSIHIYLGTKAGSNFDSNTDWPTVESLTEVFADAEAVIGKEVGWETYTFSAPYSYDPANGNLVVVVTRQSSSYSSISAYSYTTTSNAVLYRSSDTDATCGDLASVVSMNGYRSGELPNAQFTLNYTAAVCNRPTTAPEVSDLTTTGATLTWGAVEGATTYEYVLAAAGADVDWATAQQASTNSVALTGLTPGTVYNFYVRNYCSADAQSAAVSATFTTECEAITEFPWSEDFEQMPLDVISTTCWLNEHISGNGTYTFKVLNTSNGGNLSHQGVLPDMSAGTITRLSLPVMEFDAANAYMLTIDVYRNTSYSSYKDEGLRIFAGEDTLAFISRNYTTADGTRIPAESASGWYTYELVIPNAGAQHIIIQGESKYGSATYFDNLVVDRVPTCLKVSDIHVVEGSETADGATIAWTPGTAAPQYKVVATLGSDTAVNTIVSEPQYTFSGLTAGHHHTYVVSVQALCSEEDNSKVVGATVNFDTECAIISELPWKEDFENFVTGSSAGAPLCWDVINFNEGNYPYVYVNNNSNYVTSGSKSLYMQAGANRNGIVILPEFASTIDLTTQEIAFWYRNEGTSDYNGTIEVGYVTDIADSASFVALQTLERTTTKTEVLQPLAAVPAGARLAFQYVGGTNNNYNAAIDDVVVRKATTCFKPSAIHAIDSLSTTSSATIAWTAPEQGAAQYRVTVTKGNDTLVSNVLTADTFYVIENLAHSSTYRISATVNSVCGEEDESEAVTAAVVVTTLCATITEFPWSEDFENYATGTSANDINCFSTFDVVGNANDWMIYSSTAHNSSRSLYAKYTSSGLGRTTGAVELPEMILEEGKPYVFNYWLQGSSYGSSDTVTVYVGDTVLHTFVSATDLGSSWNEINDTIIGTGEVIRFGLTFNNLDGYFVYLDDITVDHIYKNVTFQNFDSTELQNGPVAVGYVPVYEGETPVKPATAQYTYTFKGWDAELAAVTEDIVYTAQFDSVVNEYQIVFQNYDGTVLQSTNVAYGEQAAYTGETPQKPATAQYTYTFKGWDVEPALVEAAATYTAEYDSVVNNYTVFFKDWDGTILAEELIPYGGAAVAPADPVREGYTFTGWDADFSNITGPLTVNAQYELINALDNIDATRAVKFVKDGQMYIRRGNELFDATGRKVE